MICEICKREFEKPNNLSNHLTRTHKISTQQYYDKYLKPSDTCNLCVICGKPTKFINLSVGYKKHCSPKCAANDEITKDRKRQANLEKYGVPCNLNFEEVKKKAKSDEVKEKIKSTTMERYGVTCALQQDYVREKVKSKEVQDKINKTVYERYGTTRFNVPSVRNAANIATHTKEAEMKRQNTVLKRKGVRFAFHTEEAKEKSRLKAHLSETKQKSKATKMANHTWNSSSVEIDFAQRLDSLGISYRHNYSTEKYPWKCDFYLVDLDMYIELNLFFTHGGHYYSGTDEDLQQVEKWKSSGSEFCSEAIHNWTQSDILKRDTAIKNDLTYIVLWNKEQIEKFFELNFTFKGFIDFNEI